MAYDLERRMAVIEERYANIDRRLGSIEVGIDYIKKMIIGNGTPGLCGRLAKVEWITFGGMGLIGMMIPVVIKSGLDWLRG